MLLRRARLAAPPAQPRLTLCPASACWRQWTRREASSSASSSLAVPRAPPDLKMEYEGLLPDVRVRDQSLRREKNRPRKKPQFVDIPAYISCKDLAHKLHAPIVNFYRTVANQELFDWWPKLTIRQLRRTGWNALESVVLSYPEAAKIAATFRVLGVPQDVGYCDLERAPLPLLAPRAAVVSFVGHAGHGKTTLLDHLRPSGMARRERYGLTQDLYHHRARLQLPDTAQPPHGHAVSSKHNELNISLVDTPGHANFFEARANAVSFSDVVVLVVAADEGVLPQTEECIRYALKWKVPTVVALNKLDGTDPAAADKTKRQLQQAGLTLAGPAAVARGGGPAPLVEVSGSTGYNVNLLMHTLARSVQQLDPRTDMLAPAAGVVVDSWKEKGGRGKIIRVLVSEGQLRLGEHFVCGVYHGRVKDMRDSLGLQVGLAGPGTIVDVMGAKELPLSGDEFFVASKTMAETTSKVRLLEQSYEEQDRIVGAQVDAQEVMGPTPQQLAAQEQDQEDREEEEDGDQEAGQEALPAALRFVKMKGEGVEDILSDGNWREVPAQRSAAQPAQRSAAQPARSPPRAAAYTKNVEEEEEEEEEEDEEEYAAAEEEQIEEQQQPDQAKEEKQEWEQEEDEGMEEVFASMPWVRVRDSGQSEGEAAAEEAAAGREAEKALPSMPWVTVQDSSSDQSSADDGESERTSVTDRHMSRELSKMSGTTRMIFEQLMKPSFLGDKKIQDKAGGMQHIDHLEERKQALQQTLDALEKEMRSSVPDGPGDEPLDPDMYDPNKQRDLDRFPSIGDERDASGRRIKTRLPEDQSDERKQFEAMSLEEQQACWARFMQSEEMQMEQQERERVWELVPLFEVADRPDDPARLREDTEAPPRKLPPESQFAHLVPPATVIVKTDNAVALRMVMDAIDFYNDCNPQQTLGVIKAEIGRVVMEDLIMAKGENAEIHCFRSGPENKRVLNESKNWHIPIHRHTLFTEFLHGIGTAPMEPEDGRDELRRTQDIAQAYESQVKRKIAIVTGNPSIAARYPSRKTPKKISS